MITEFLNKLINRQNLTLEEIASILIALQTKGICADELTGFAQIMREKALKISPKVDFCVDMCGTGGDGFSTFNISTTVAFVVSACGIKVAKHGNRAASSKSGSADVLKSLGVRIELTPDQVCKSIEEIGIGFLFAPLYHLAMKYVMPIRKTLKTRTIFNLLGPLLNPAQVKYQVIGVYDPNVLSIYAETMQNLGFENAMVVHGNGLDEISTTGPTQVFELENGRIMEYEIKPEDFGFKRAKVEDLKGGDPEENAEILRNILAGKEKGAKLDIVLLNSAAVLKVCKKVSSWEKGIEMAREVLENGEAEKKLENLIAFGNRE